jgi:hypothetical protein
LGEVPELLGDNCICAGNPTRRFSNEFQTTAEIFHVKARSFLSIFFIVKNDCKYKKGLRNAHPAQKHAISDALY